MRSLALSAFVLLLIAGCATAPQKAQEPPKEYQIPIVKANGTVDHYTVEPDDKTLGDNEQMLFCIEGPDTVVCIAQNSDNLALRYYFPIPHKPEFGG